MKTFECILDLPGKRQGIMYVDAKNMVEAFDRWHKLNKENLADKEPKNIHLSITEVQKGA